MKKSQKIINILLSISILVGDVLYITTNHLLAKSITSLLFVALGSVNLSYAIKEKVPAKKFCIIMVVGLFFAMLGDIILAEPKALVGFAGKRVIQQTANAAFPENFQTAEFLLEHGFIDAIVPREQMKETLTLFCAQHRKAGKSA